MNRNSLKIIAVTAMITDHIAWKFFSEMTAVSAAMHTIGRLTAPIMCFFIAEGFRYTSSRKKYGLRLFIFAVISQPCFGFFEGDIIRNGVNVIFTLFLAFLALTAYENIEAILPKSFAILGICVVSVISDWGIFAILWTLIFYIYHDDKKMQTLGFSIVAVSYVVADSIVGIYAGGGWYSRLWQAGVLLFIPLLFAYNGKPGIKNKFTQYFFYVFYPLHFVALELISRVI